MPLHSFPSAVLFSAKHKREEKNSQVLHFSRLCGWFIYFAIVYTKDIYRLLNNSLTDVDSNTYFKLKNDSHKVMMASKRGLFFSKFYYQTRFRCS